MKLAITFVLLGLAMSPAWAAPIAGKWGFSGQAFNSSNDFGLIRGVSDRRAWILDFRVMQVEGFFEIEPTPPFPEQENSFNGWNVFAGPRRRSYTRAEGDLSPYWDLYLDGSFGQTHGFSSSGSQDQRNLGISLGSDVGIEYFTPWGLSVAAHSQLVQFSWNHVRTEARSGVQSGHTQNASVGITPGLYVRLYF